MRHIVADVHSFCPGCWSCIEFPRGSGCTTCGLPLEATEAESSGVCLAKAPRISRTRVAVSYGDVARSLAIRLKYGCKVVVARTMARSMAPLIEQSGEENILVHVSLHRTRLWQRGFNQSALVAKELSRRLQLRSDPLA
jgi:predicted amidophosphoribosyltransferase